MNYGLLAIYVVVLLRLLWAAHVHGKPFPNERYHFSHAIAHAGFRLLLVWWALDWRFF